jgi:ABC-type cobalamin/Fe3+-siderophores transport system ATPase subunit
VNPPRLELRQVAAGYRGVPVVRDVSLCVRPGEMLALIGENGAGKSTLLRVASGVVAPLEGQAFIDGSELVRLQPKERAQRIAVVPQEAPLPNGLFAHEMVALGRTPYTRVLFGPTARDRRAVEWAMQVAGVESFAARFVDELSGGERQRVILARALAQQPILLLLDEPTANLDLHHQVAMLELVRGLSREQGLGVVAAVHDLQLAALYCDRVALLHSGRIISQGPPEDVLTESLLLQAFGQRVVLSAHPTHGVPLVALVPNGNARRLVTELRGDANSSLEREAEPDAL